MTRNNSDVILTEQVFSKISYHNSKMKHPILYQGPVAQSLIKVNQRLNYNEQIIDHCTNKDLIND